MDEMSTLQPNCAMWGCVSREGAGQLAGMLTRQGGLPYAHKAGGAPSGPELLEGAASCLWMGLWQWQGSSFGPVDFSMSGEGRGGGKAPL